MRIAARALNAMQERIQEQLREREAMIAAIAHDLRTPLARLRLGVELGTRDESTRAGMVADIVIFDPDTVKPLPLEVVHDFPTGAKRIKEPAQGIHMTIVNGEVLLEDGKHTGALPGRLLRGPLARATA